MKVLIRKQRNEIYTVKFAVDGAMPDDNSVDARYNDSIRIFGLVGPVGLSLLLRTDLESIHAMTVGETIQCELEARIINDSDQKENYQCPTILSYQQ
jgi:predicted amino acid dehydrogenase